MLNCVGLSVLVGRDFLTFLKTHHPQHVEEMMPRKPRIRFVDPHPPHALPKYKRPKLEDFSKKFHGSNTAIDQLLNRIDLKSKKKYLLVFDIDGTMMQSFPNDMFFDVHRAGKSPDALVQKLTEINAKYPNKVKAVSLTARNLEEFKLWETFNQISIYGAFGYAHQKERDYIPHFLTSLQGYLDDPLPAMYVPEYGISELAKEYLRRGLQPFEIHPLMDFTVDPNAVCLKLRDHNIKYKEDIKGLVLHILKETPKQVRLNADEHWICTESTDGSYLIFNNGKTPFNKADGINYVLRNENIDDDTTVIIFGDSGTDLKAMKEDKKVLGKDRVINVAVGSQIAKEKDVDLVFRDHIDTRRFVGRLAQKLAA